MLINLYIFCFFLFIILMFIIVNINKSRSIFDLNNFFLLFCLAEIPYLFYLNNNQSIIHNYVKKHLVDYELVFSQHIILKVIFIAVALFAMTLISIRLPKIEKACSIEQYSYRDIRFFSVILVFLTAGIYAVFLYKVGGLLYLLLNLSNKTLVVQGTAMFRNGFFVTSFLSVGFFIHYCSIKLSLGKCIKYDKFILFFLLIIFFIMLASFGERKNPILLLIYSIVSWNFSVSKVKLLTLKNILLFSGLLFFAALAPVLRKHNATEYYLSNPIELLMDALPYIGEVFKRFSEIDISLFIFSYFQGVDQFWFGATFIDFLTGFIPSSFYPDKPPLDEGVYIYALAHFNNVTPPVPFHSMAPVGWPLSRVTAGYVHFGVIGVAVSAFIVGVILRLVSNIYRFSNCSPYAGFFYCTLIVTGFGLTNAFVFNNLIYLFIIFSMMFLTFIISGVNK
ncbi:hypothetical protein K0H59_07145 [Shewanella sp. FJAT-51649]|uniref:hypothetical protein n=1 Tax=Shewanella sp. FJAT-51649 TaxID=2864210 RepID=UPI001C655509|nr:hypothetical protein [Shewanella sp. FJAT-51649]QYJ72799.1 hypothetical protein K0H59_07145 [Shewanella sp. FJAT-51649]